MKRPFLKAFIGGLTISLIPAWFVTYASRAFPNLAPEDLQVITDFFTDASVLLQWIVFFIFVIVMPIIEEILFRGLLWRLFNWKFSPKTTWILVSLIFAGVHWEPLHVIGLLPLSFFIGWLRLKTNELGPSIIAHMTNNAVGCFLMMM